MTEESSYDGDASHLDDGEIALVAMAGDDDAVRGHLSGCSRCAAAVHSARRTLALLDVIEPPRPPSPTVLRAIELEVLSKLPRRGVLRSIRGLAALLAGTLLLATARSRAPGAEAWLEAMTVGALGVLGAAIGSRREARLLGVMLALSGGLAWLAASIDGLFPTLGVKCVAIESFAAALPLASAIFAARRWALPLPSLQAAVVAASGALVGQAALHLTCPVRDAAAHLAVFHLGGVVLAALVGAVAPRLASPPRHLAAP